MNPYIQSIQNYINRNSAVFTSLSDDIWAHPELSLQEHYAAERYQALLRDHGFQVTENLGGIATAFCGSFGQGKPVIGILGEFDALSGLSQAGGMAEPQALEPGGCGHGCGHNLLGAGSLAAAFAVKHILEETGLPGTVIFFGCPGEEGGASKAFLARDGLWAQLDAALTWHPSDVNETRTGTNNSSIQVLYKFHGVAAHAATDPAHGRSALDAVELMNLGVQFLREHMEDCCRVHYAILDAGGVSPNVVQPEASVLYMVRADRVQRSLDLQARVDKIAQGAALMTETTLERIFIDGTADLLPNFALEDLLHKNLEAMGLPGYTPAELDFAAALKATYAVSGLPGCGPRFDSSLARWMREKTENLTRPLNDFVLPACHSNQFTAGSTDVGDVSWLTPTAQIETVCFPSGAPGHSWQNVSCGRTSIAHKGLLYAAAVLAATALDLLTDPETLAAVRAEYKARSAEGYVCPIEPDAVPRIAGEA